MSFLQELLDMLRRRSARARFIHSATGEQWHDRKHLGAGAELQDREQVGQIVAQDIAGDGNRVFAGAYTFQGGANRVHRGEDADVEPGGVVILQIALRLRDHVAVVCPLLIEPENCGRTGRARPIDGELDPVPDGEVFRLAHAPDVSLADFVSGQNLACGIHDADDTLGRDLERLVMRAVFFGRLRHEADITDVAHGRDVECPMQLTVIDRRLIDPGVAPVRNHCFGVVRFAVGSPHTPGGSDRGGHRCIDDHIAGNVEVGDSLG